MTDRHTRGFEGGRTKGRRIGTLWWNINAASGDVTMSAYFDEEMDSLEQADALSDIIGLLKREYEICLTDFDNEMKELGATVDDSSPEEPTP